MALQGTLETFALPDVLHLLASTKKSGVLRVDTDRGSGEVHVADGALTGGSVARAPRAERPADVLFEMLRGVDGTFLFDADAVPSAGGEAVAVDVALAAAEEQLAEWREIELVVPSPHRPITLRAEQDAPITLDPDQWRAVAALAGGCTVDALGERLALTELATARTVRDLVGRGAITLGDDDVVDLSTPAPAASAPPVPAPPAVEPAPVEPAPGVESAPIVDASPAPVTPPYEPLRLAEPPAASSDDRSDAPGLPPLPGVDIPSSSPGNDAAFAPPASASMAEVSPLFGTPTQAPVNGSAPWSNDESFGSSPMSSFFDDDDEDPLADDPFGPDPFRLPRLPTPETATDPEAAEMARQLANLSPRAAQAVAAAAAASTAEEREQALAAVPQDGEDPVNRGLLLKFLSSVEE